MSRIGVWVATGASTIIATGLLACLNLQDLGSAKSAKLGYSHERSEEQSREDRFDEPEAFQRMWEARREGTGELSPAQINYAVSQEVARIQSLRSATGNNVPAWGFQELGPGNFGGRSRGLIVHPTNTNRILFSSVSGGLWRSEDEGQSWTPVADFIANLAVGSIVIDPDNPNRVFIGTGEGFFNGDAARGAGVFVSQDFGTSWTQLAATNNSDFHYVNRLARVPGSNTIIAAARSGLWRSTDLGVNWQRVATGFVVDNRGYTDVKTDPSTPNRLLAYHFGSAGGRGPIPELAVAGLPTIVGVQMAVGPATPLAPLNANLIIANDGSGVVTDGCEAFPPASLTGRIVLIDRGTCAFVLKVQNAQAAGAAYVVIGQNVADAPFAGGAVTPGVTISSMMISLADANTIKAASNGIVGDVLFISGFENPGSAPLNAQVTGPQVLTNYLVRSIDGGASWTQLTAANGLPETTIGRGEIGWGPSGTVYTAFANNGDTTRGLWRSTDGGATWTQAASTAAFIERQGWYDLVTAVAPNDSNRVYLGAVDQFVSSDGGATITKNSFWNPTGSVAGGLIRDYIHADHHSYSFKPGVPTTIYTTSDGGIQRSTDSGANYFELNFGLNAAMPNNVSVSPNGRVMHGTQDNGSHFTQGFDDGVWLEWSGGDGGNTAADQQDSNFFYSGRPFGDFFGTGTGGTSEADLPLAVAGSNANSLFYAPIAIDPNNGNRLAVGVAGVQFTANARALAGSTWTQIAPPVGFGGVVNTITISALDGTKAYAGSTAGNLMRITGLGTSNTVSSMQGNLPAGADISQITVDRDDANHLYVVLADYGNTPKVYETFNEGTTWTSIQGSLPIVPMFTLVQVPGVTGQLLLGSEVGLWHGTRVGNGPVTWERFDYGIPFTRVTGITNAGNDMYIAVYGRSAFKVSRSPLLVSIGEARTDTGCDTDGNLDQGESIIVPVTVRNLSNQGLSAISLQLASSNARNGLIPPAVIPVLGPNASITQNMSVAMSNVAGLCPDAATLTATASVNSVSSSSTRTLGLDQNTAALTALVDGAESANTLLVTASKIGPDTWTRVNTQSNTGTFSWFASNTDSVSEKTLGSPWMNVTSPTAALAFALRYDTEGDATQHWDGAVLEARSRSNIDGQPSKWIDIGAASTIAYDGPLFNNTTLGPSRNAWSGAQTTWRNASVSLAAFNGQQIQFRFRFVSDTSAAVTGFWVDDINATGVSLKGLATCDSTCN
jgi:PA domain/Immune inhibitor A peptidase M6